MGCHVDRLDALFAFADRVWMAKKNHFFDQAFNGLLWSLYVWGVYSCITI